MSSLIFGQEEEFLKKRFNEMMLEFDKIRINSNYLNHAPSSEELEEIDRFNTLALRELGGCDGVLP